MMACYRRCKPLRKQARRVSPCAVGRMYKASAKYSSEREVACAVSDVGEWGSDLKDILEGIDAVKAHFEDDNIGELLYLLRVPAAQVKIREVIKTIRKMLVLLKKFQGNHRFLRYVVKKLLLVKLLIVIIESLLGLSDLFGSITSLVGKYDEYGRKWSCDKVIKCK